ncbi:hypothetical protein [Streptomyces sp. NPDC054834]
MGNGTKEANLQRRRALQDAEFARDAERRRNGLGAAPVRTERPASPAGPVRVKPRRKRSTKVMDARGRASSAPRATNSGEGRMRTPVKLAPAYMRLTPEEVQRERRRREAREKKDAKRLAKKAAQAARMPGTARSRTKKNGTKPQATKPRPAGSG